jgi:hypothetical protein
MILPLQILHKLRRLWGKPRSNPELIGAYLSPILSNWATKSFLNSCFYGSVADPDPGLFCRIQIQSFKTESGSEASKILNRFWKVSFWT